jgi:hypothetical protein
LLGFSGLSFSGTRRLGFSGRICCFWPGFSGCSFYGMGNLKKTLWAAGKLFWYLQRDFLSLIREFSGGKLKQKGFFHSVYMYREPGFGAMEQPWTIQSGGLASQKLALSGTVWSCMTINFG